MSIKLVQMSLNRVRMNLDVVIMNLMNFFLFEINLNECGQGQKES